MERTIYQLTPAPKTVFDDPEHQYAVRGEDLHVGDCLDYQRINAVTYDGRSDEIIAASSDRYEVLRPNAILWHGARDTLVVLTSLADDEDN